MKAGNYNLTTKQLHIMRIVLAGNGIEDGKFVPIDLDQLIERVTYAPTKEAMQFSVRFLVKKGMMFKSGFANRRGRKRVLYTPTEEAFVVIGGNKEEMGVLYGTPVVLPELGKISVVTEPTIEEPEVPSDSAVFLEEIEDIDAALPEFI
jgi:hypothetical protein